MTDPTPPVDHRAEVTNADLRRQIAALPEVILGVEQRLTATLAAAPAPAPDPAHVAELVAAARKLLSGLLTADDPRGIARLAAALRPFETEGSGR